jgi:hypothetical protein
MAFAKVAVLKVLLEPTPRNSLAGLFFYFYLSAFATLTDARRKSSRPPRRQVEEQRKQGSMQCHLCACH